MKSRIGANAIAATHFAVGLFAVFGGMLIFASRWWAAVHIPLAAWMAVVNLADLTCPLTVWERALGERYEGGFVEHYGAALPCRSPRQLEITIGAVILVWNVVFYGAVVLGYLGS